MRTMPFCPWMVALLVLPAGARAQEAPPRTGIELTAGIGVGLGGPGYTDRVSGTLDAAVVRRLDPARRLDRLGIAVGAHGLRSPDIFTPSFPFPPMVSLTLLGGGAWPVGTDQELRLLAGPVVARAFGEAAEFIARDRGGAQVRVDLVGRTGPRLRFALAGRAAWLSPAGDAPFTLLALGVGLHF